TGSRATSVKLASSWKGNSAPTGSPRRGRRPSPITSQPPGTSAARASASTASRSRARWKTFTPQTSCTLAGPTSCAAHGWFTSSAAKASGAPGHAARSVRSARRRESATGSVTRKGAGAASGPHPASGHLVDEGEEGGVGGIRRQALGAHRRRIRRGERGGQAIAAAGLARRHAREREPLEEPAERGREARDEAARGEQLLDRAGLGEERRQLEPRHQVDRELEHVVLDQLAAPVLARAEERVAEARLGEERVETRIDGRGDE